MFRPACFALALTAVASSASAAPDGFLDPTFGQGGRQVVGSLLAFAPIFNYGIGMGGMAVLPDGHIVLAGAVLPADQWGIALARVKPNGDVDDGFGQPIWFLPANANAPVFVSDLVAQSDGKLVAVATVVGSHGLVCRFRPDGSLDTSFATLPPNPSAPGCRSVHGDGVAMLTAAALQRDGRILVSGATATLDSEVAHAMAMRLDAHGNPDPGFDGDGMVVLLPQSPAITWLTDVAPTPDGDVIVVGNASAGDNTDWVAFRLRGEDGVPDETFDGDGLKPIAINQVPGGNDRAVAVDVLTDGRIVIAGEAEGMNGTCPVVARLLPDGTNDPGLDGGGLFVGSEACLSGLSITDMLVQSNGRIVLAGGWSENFFATRILPQGGFDSSFGTFDSSWFDFGPIYGVDHAGSHALNIASHSGRLLLSGFAAAGDAIDLAIARLDNDLIYTDGLE